MIYQCHFTKEQESFIFKNGPYQGFGLEPEVNASLLVNCPELSDPHVRTALTEYAALLHIWRNLPFDKDDWIGFTSYRQLDKSPHVFASAGEVAKLLATHDLLAWHVLSVGHVRIAGLSRNGLRRCWRYLMDGRLRSGSLAGAAAQAERCHPGLHDFMVHVLGCFKVEIPEAYFFAREVPFANYWVLSKARFASFMEWSWPMVKYALDADHFYTNRKTSWTGNDRRKAIGYFVERVFVIWTMLYPLRTHWLGPISEVSPEGYELGSNLREAIKPVNCRPDSNVSSLISIPLCTYNGAQFLSEQLDSLFVQTHQHFEIIAVDDCSTDDSLKILHEYARRDARLQVHVNEVNLGLKRNFAIALQKCTGDFIAPCDQDDIWMPEKLVTLLNVIGTHAMAYSNSELVSVSGQQLGILASDHVAMLNTHDPAAFVFNNCVSGHAMLFRRQVLDIALPLPNEFFHDWWLAACAASSGGVVCHAQPLVKYRQHATNLTNMARDRIVQRKQQAPGFRLNALRETERRIDLLSKLPGPSGSLLKQLQQLWRRRESQWLSFSLSWFMALYGGRFYATRKQASFLFLMRRTIYYLWGVRFKRFANQYAYAIEPTELPAQHPPA